MPGIAASTSETWELGSPPNAVAAPENSFAFEVTWAWISRPITTSQSPVEPLISFDGAAGAFMATGVQKEISGSIGLRATAGASQAEEIDVPMVETTAGASKPAAKRLVGLALAQRVGAALDQEIDLVRRQREPCRDRIEDAGARGRKLIEIHPVDEEIDVVAAPVIADAETGTLRRRQAASPVFDLPHPVIGQAAECRVTRSHAGIDGGVGRRRYQFNAARPFDPLREVAGDTPPGIDDKEHDPPHLHGLPLVHRLERALRGEHPDAETGQAIIVDEAAVEQLHIAHRAIVIAGS